MTELRKGQRVWVEAEITDPKPDKWGFVRAYLVRDGVDYDSCTADIIEVDTDGPMIPPKAGAPTHTYLARREASMSERKWIEVSREGHGSGPWVMVAPVDARGNEHAPVAVNRSVLRDAPDDEELREERDAWESDAWRAEGERNEARRERDALRDRVAELERECAQWREHTERRGDEIDDWMGRANDLGIERDRLVRERDEARREAEELRQERYRLRHELEEAENVARYQPVYPGDINSKPVVKSLVSRGIVRKNRDGDYVLRTPYIEDVDHLRAENERLRQLLSGYMPEDLIGRHLADPGPHEAEDPPAPQTHYRAGDLVGCGHKTFRLDAFISHIGDGENWHSKDSCTGSVAPTPGVHPILERDGTPTDAGLERLAEKAGCELRRNVDPGLGGFAVEERNVWVAQQLTDDDRRALAAALREMRGA